MELIIATNNAHKAQELGEILKGFQLVTMREAGLDMDIAEDGKSFAENAMIKARAVFERLHKPCFADDSGLCVDALDGAPGIYSARFAGEGADSAERNAKLLRLLENVPEERRTARFVCTMACILDEQTAFTVEGVCEGSILYGETGENGFGYDPVFRAAGYNCSMAELSPQEKNTISHRARAASALRGKIQEILGGADSMLDSKKRAYLRKLANPLDTLFQVGRGGITENMVKQLSDTLEVRELVKMRVLENSLMTAREAAEELAEAAGAEVVQVIGSRFTLYRASRTLPAEKRIVLPK